MRQHIRNFGYVTLMVLLALTFVWLFTACSAPNGSESNPNITVLVTRTPESLATPDIYSIETQYLEVTSDDEYGAVEFNVGDGVTVKRFYDVQENSVCYITVVKASIGGGIVGDTSISCIARGPQ